MAYDMPPNMAMAANAPVVAMVAVSIRIPRARDPDGMPAVMRPSTSASICGRLVRRARSKPDGGSSFLNLMYHSPQSASRNGLEELSNLYLCIRPPRRNPYAVCERDADICAATSPERAATARVECPP